MKIIRANVRTRRLTRFLDQISVFLYMRAVEAQLPTSPINRFVSDMFKRMAASDEEFTTLDLMSLLCDADTREGIFAQYQSRIM